MPTGSFASTFRVLISGKEKLLVRFIGPITEGVDFEPVRFAKLKPIEIDLSEVTALNSIGIREFTSWSSKLENKVIEFSHCPQMFVDQLNMIKGFVPPQSRVISFYVPFFDAAAEEEKIILFSQGLEFVGSGAEVKLNIPLVKSRAGNPMELDVIPEKYFRFLKQFS